MSAIIEKKWKAGMIVKGTMDNRDLQNERRRFALR